MKTVEYKCDACEQDLSDAGAMPKYRIELAPEAIQNSGGIMYSVAVSPPINRLYHFCGLGCLDLWRDRERHKSGLWRAWNEKWKDDHCNRAASNGTITSWRSAPDEVRAAAAAEIEAATLTAFPAAARRPK